VLPAEALAKAQSARARGDAAPTIENGRATAEALGVVASEWAAAGDAGRDVYVLQQLDAIIGAAVRRVSQMEVGALEVVDGSDGESLGAALGAFPRGVATVLEETGKAMGIDVRALLAPRSVVSGAGPDTLRGGAR
jgi:flotillin